MWFDAICINQDDLSEKGAQVGRMGSIYERAHGVVAGLGPQSGNSALVLETLDFLGRQVEVTRDDWRLPAPGNTQGRWFSSSVDLPYSDNEWQALEDLVSRPWFVRLWVMQEIVLGSDRAVLQCGSDVIEWDLFRRATLVLNDKTRLPSVAFRERLGLLGNLTRTSSQETFDTLLGRTRVQACSDPADKIYAIITLGAVSYTHLTLPT